MDNQSNRDPVYNPTLQCDWYGLVVHDAQTLLLLLDEDSAPDMTGSLEIAKVALPDARTIVAVEASTAVVLVMYERVKRGWEARQPPAGGARFDGALRLNVTSF